MAKPLTLGLVDDDPDVLLAFDNMLTSYGYQTELYTSGEQFLNTAQASKAACLVVDVKLGDITGIELARQLSANGFRFPIIFMSGDADDVVLRQAAELSRADFLHKPFSMGQLIDAITQATGGSADSVVENHAGQ